MSKSWFKQYFIRIIYIHDTTYTSTTNTRNIQKVSRRKSNDLFYLNLYLIITMRTHFKQV